MSSMKEIFANKTENDVIEIYAALSKRQYAQIQNQEVELEIPFNTELSHKRGSKSLFFTCYGKLAAQELADGLDTSGMSWQEAYTGPDL